VEKSVYRWGKNKEITGKDNIRMKLILDFIARIVTIIIIGFAGNKVINMKFNVNIDYTNKVEQSPKNPT
jgi:hypothetical protein